MAKKKTNIAEIRSKDSRELRYDLDQERKKLFDLSFQPDAESQDTSGVRAARRTIARILTVLKERELQGAAEAGSESQS